MRRLIITVIAALVVAACGKSDAPPEPVETASPEAPEATTLEGAYEALRVSLVNDDLEATRRAARTLAKHAGSDEAIAEAARAMGSAEDLAAARLAFGDASRAYITRLANDPERAGGKYAFRCPMAKGYKKWVQLNDEIENPYMGQRMLECGGPVAMEP